MIDIHAQARGSFTFQASLDEAVIQLFKQILGTRSFPFVSLEGQDDIVKQPRISFTQVQARGTLPFGFSLDPDFHRDGRERKGIRILPLLQKGQNNIGFGKGVAGRGGFPVYPVLNRTSQPALE
jgi:hypothetical protein